MPYPLESVTAPLPKFFGHVDVSAPRATSKGDTTTLEELAACYFLPAYFPRPN